MTRCIVHIGMHKTGSTSIQHSLHGFSDAQFLYARLGDDPNHSLAMYSVFAAEPGLHHMHRSSRSDASTVSRYVEKIRADLAEAVRTAKGRTLIISGEDISALRRDALIRLRDDFDKRFEDVVLVGYVRSPTGLMTSTFQHRVSLGLVDRFDPGRQYRSYKDTFGIFDEVFGRNRVNLWKFDVGRFRERCAVRDFCTRLSIDLPEEKIVRLNESVPRHVVALLYTYYKSGLNGASAMTGAERKKLLDCLAAIGNDPFRLSADVIKPILEKQRADISWMESRLGQSLYENIGEHHPGDVRDEADLLYPDFIVNGKLVALLGDKAPPGIRGDTPEDVARLVHALITTNAQPPNNVGVTKSFLGERVTALLQFIFR